MRTVIFDIDGTLADLSHRRHYVTARPKNFARFAAEACNDRPVEHMRWLHNALVRQREVQIIYCTGRLEAERQATVDWLVTHEFLGACQHPLFMRPDADRFIPDSEVKRAMLAQLRERGFEIVMVFDDRNKVVDMWRSEGIPCAQVAPGDF